MALTELAFVLLSGDYGSPPDGWVISNWEFLLTMLGLFVGLVIAVAYLVSSLIHARNPGGGPRSGLFITAAAMIPTLYVFILWPALR